MGKRYQRFQQALRERTIGILIVAIIFMFVAIYLWQRIVITIMPGEAGVLWQLFLGGTRTDYIYSEGLRLIWPWDKMYIYDIRVQQTAHEFDVLTVDGLKLHLAISIRYYPEREMLGVLHQKVGPDYVNTVVIPEIEAVLRVLIGRLHAEEVYATERSIIEEAVNSAVEQIAQRFINVDDVLIKRIEFPPFIVQAIEAKMEQQQLAEAYGFRLTRERKEAERKRIEAEGLRDYNQLLATSLSDQILLWKGIQATLELAQSQNAKIVVIGSGEKGLPVIGNLPLDIFPNTTAIAPEPSGQPAASAAPAENQSAPAETPASAPALSLSGPHRPIDQALPAPVGPPDSERPATQAEPTAVPTSDGSPTPGS
jgi:regulator of protease activity HflC (stomatin/prohibitin superfamily)